MGLNQCRRPDWGPWLANQPAHSESPPRLSRPRMCAAAVSKYQQDVRERGKRHSPTPQPFSTSTDALFPTGRGLPSARGLFLRSAMRHFFQASNDKRTRHLRSGAQRPLPWCDLEKGGKTDQHFQGKRRCLLAGTTSSLYPWRVANVSCLTDPQIPRVLHSGQAGFDRRHSRGAPVATCRKELTRPTLKSPLARPPLGFETWWALRSNGRQPPLDTTEDAEAYHLMQVGPSGLTARSLVVILEGDPDLIIKSEVLWPLFLMRKPSGRQHCFTYPGW